jgi:hypothetical protein
LLGVRDAQEFLVELSDAVAADLAKLTRALDEPGVDLETLLRQLSDSCAVAVASYLGFSITIVVGDYPISLALLEDFLDPTEILTSLMLPLGAIEGDGFGGELTLYAGAVGAFVDLAADLSYALGAEAGVIQLDHHLLPPTQLRGATGLDHLTVQNQAIGILLDRGLSPDDARGEIHRAARLDQVSVDVVAQRLIRSMVLPLASEPD